MLRLSGAADELCRGIEFLVCDICLRVRAPRGAPKTTWLAPQHFNQRVSGDTFFVHAADRVKWAVIHFVDDLTDLQAGDLVKHPSSQSATDTLNDRWVSLHGPMEELIVDQDPEFHRHLITYCDLMAIQLQYAVLSAKWKNAKAERHGAMAKIMLIRIIVELDLTEVSELRYAVQQVFSAKNRLLRSCGWSPLQAAQGRDSIVPIR